MQGVKRKINRYNQEVMKKYLLFAGGTHYPEGGAEDYQIDSDNIEDLQVYFIEHADDICCTYIDNWAQIADSKTMKIVLYGRVSHIIGDYHKVGPDYWAATLEEILYL